MVTDVLNSVSGPSFGLQYYLVAASILFSLGLVACLSRRNAIGILIGIELMLNAGILNFMSFWRFIAVDSASGADINGPLVGVFVIVLAACEAAVALAVLLNLYFNFGTVEVDSVHELRH